MPLLGPIEKIINCSDIGGCFQAIYNLLFLLFVIFAFFNFFFGALQYLFSGANIFSAESGRKKMINSLFALAVVLLLPQILNYINPNIFQVQWFIPKIEKLKPVE
ncbi:MAG: hypothetical protein C4347_00920, partial [Patescibacteria group bacterium]